LERGFNPKHREIVDEVLSRGIQSDGSEPDGRPVKPRVTMVDFLCRE
jgi:hypothetical protein